MTDEGRRAGVADVHAIAASMPHVTVLGEHGKVGYQVGNRSFVFFRNPRPDATDPATGERLSDVIVIWVPDDSDKQSLIQDPNSPFFTTPHFDGHSSVLLRAAHLDRLTVAQLREVIEDAWLSRASAKRGRDWVADNRG